jgi:enoyl-[acyl-carrier protein] reductase I
MAGKRGLVMGVANDRSIAWGIARAVAAEGAVLAFTYQGDALLKRVKPLADSVAGTHLLPCDVGDEASLDAVFATLAKDWGALDFVVHAIAFSDKEELKGRYVDITRQNCMTMDSPAFLTAVSQRAVKLMRGRQPADPHLLRCRAGDAHYNVMGVAKAALEASVRYLAADLGSDGIRVNAISAGPIKTLAAMGIGDFRHILRWNELNAPLKRNVTIEQVGNAGLYLLSDLSQGVTGEVHHVDSGYHVVGMLRTDAVPEVRVMLQNFEPKG